MRPERLTLGERKFVAKLAKRTDAIGRNLHLSMTEGVRPDLRSCGSCARCAMVNKLVEINPATLKAEPKVADRCVWRQGALPDFCAPDKVGAFIVMKDGVGFAFESGSAKEVDRQTFVAACEAIAVIRGVGVAYHDENGSIQIVANSHARRGDVITAVDKRMGHVFAGGIVNDEPVFLVGPKGSTSRLLKSLTDKGATDVEVLNERPFGVEVHSILDYA